MHTRFDNTNLSESHMYIFIIFPQLEKKVKYLWGDKIVGLSLVKNEHSSRYFFYDHLKQFCQPFSLKLPNEIFCSDIELI